jgi:hypothetical protein
MHPYGQYDDPDDEEDQQDEYDTWSSTTYPEAYRKYPQHEKQRWEVEKRMQKRGKRPPISKTADTDEKGRRLENGGHPEEEEERVLGPAVQLKIQKPALPAPNECRPLHEERLPTDHGLDGDTRSPRSCPRCHRTEFNRVHRGLTKSSLTGLRT